MDDVEAIRSTRVSTTPAHRWLLVALSATACGSPAPPSPLVAPVASDPAPADLAAEATPSPPPPPRAECEAHDDVWLEVADPHFECVFRQCEGELVLTLHNCSDGEVTLDQVWLDVGGGRMSFAYEPAVTPPREARVERRPEYSPVDATAVATYRRADGTEGSTAPVPFHSTVSDPPLEEAQAACVACNGEWGAHGMSAREGCNCRTQDAGRECRARSECEGPCLFDRYERHRTPDGRQMATQVGHCAEWRMVFGCRGRIEEGQTIEVQPGARLRAPHVCAD